MLMSLNKYARSRDISSRFLYRLVKEGKIPAGRSGRRWIVIPDKVDEAIDTLFGSVAKKTETTVPIKRNGYKEALTALVGVTV